MMNEAELYSVCFSVPLVIFGIFIGIEIIRDWKQLLLEKKNVY